jgi:hypothetical protein
MWTGLFSRASWQSVARAVSLVHMSVCACVIACFCPGPVRGWVPVRAVCNSPPGQARHAGPAALQVCRVQCGAQVRSDVIQEMLPPCLLLCGLWPPLVLHVNPALDLSATASADFDLRAHVEVAGMLKEPLALVGHVSMFPLLSCLLSSSPPPPPSYRSVVPRVPGV